MSPVVKTTMQTEKGNISKNNINQNEQKLIDEAVSVWMRFNRFSKDTISICLLALALITLFGISNLTKGSLITPWVMFLQRWLGWGSYLAVLFIGMLGFFWLDKHSIRLSKIDIGRVIALEGTAFCILALLAIYGGNSLENAENGMDGGIIGWGLVNLTESFLPFPWNVPGLVLFFLIFLLYSLGFIQKGSQIIEKWLIKDNITQDNRYDNSINIPIKIATNKTPISTQTGSISDTTLRKQSRDFFINPDTATIPKERDKKLPPYSLLLEEQSNPLDQGHIHDAAALIEKTLLEFGIPSHVVGYRVGPTVTQFAVEPGYIEKKRSDGTPIRQKIRVSQISALSKDLARALSAEQLRIEAPVPGHSFVGIEAPNLKSITVRLRPLMESETFRKMKSSLTIALGKDVAGMPVVADLIRMPHLLIAGTTGSGKSICIQAITACLAINNHPDNLRLVMLDPKMVELVRFNGLPHLFGTVETELDRMLGVLRWALREMDSRYHLLETSHVRDLETYNRRLKRRNEKPLPRIVILIDELADLMMSAPDQTEHSLVRLAQMARATGIHMVIATQRPSTDVITGVIKANFPARASFTVASSVDSRVILDTNGAETLLGRGDMLFLNPEIGSPIRAQGVMISDQEINDIINFWQKQIDSETTTQNAPWEELLGEDEDGPDVLLTKAIDIVHQTQKASASLLQRRLHIGYPRAARLIDELEELNIVGPAQGGGRDREVILSTENGDEDKDGDGEQEIEEFME